MKEKEKKMNMVVRWKNLTPPSLHGGGYEKWDGTTWHPISAAEIAKAQAVGLVHWNPTDVK
jgi:hypothetical protein